MYECVHKRNLLPYNLVYHDSSPYGIGQVLLHVHLHNSDSPLLLPAIHLMTQYMLSAGNKALKQILDNFSNVAANKFVRYPLKSQTSMSISLLKFFISCYY